MNKISALLVFLFFSYFSATAQIEEQVLALDRIETSSFIVNFEYNHTGQVVTETKVGFENEYLSYKFEYEYDNNGNRILLKKHSKYSEDWLFNHYEEFEYEGIYLVKKKNFDDYGTGFRFTEQQTYTYKNAVLESVIFQSVMPDGQTFNNTIKQEFFYDKDERIFKIEQYAYVSGSWLFTDIFDIEYDDFGNLSAYALAFIYGEELVNIWRYIFHYNEDGELTERTLHYGLDGGWNSRPNEKYLYHYEDVEEEKPFCIPNIFQFDDPNIYQFHAFDFHLFQPTKKLVKNDFWKADCGGTLFYIDSSKFSYDIITLTIVEEDSLSVKHLITDYIPVYPNPTTGKLTINNEQLIISSIDFFDLFGRKVLCYLPSLSSTPISISIEHLPAGKYILSITTEKGIISKKVIKH